MLLSYSRNKHIAKAKILMFCKIYFKIKKAANQFTMKVDFRFAVFILMHTILFTMLFL